MRCKNVLAAIVCVGLSCFVLTGCISQPAETDLQEEPNYPVNSAGMTYGSMEDAQNSGFAPPVLVSAVATNGASGYMYYDDYMSATSYDRDEADSSTKEQERVSKMADAFLNKAAELYGCNLISEEESIDAVLLTGTIEGAKEIEIMLSSAISSRVKSNTTVDGTPISTNPDESALSVVAAHKKSFCAEGRSENIEEQTALDALSESVQSDQDSSLFTEYDLLYLSIVSRNSVKVPIDVFEVDGSTKIGEVLVDSR